VALVALSCTVIRPSSTTTPTGADTDNSRATRVAQEVNRTLTAQSSDTPETQEPTGTPPPSTTPSRTPTQGLVRLTPTLAAVSDESIVADERAVNGYTVQLWRSADPDASMSANIVTIAVDDSVLVRIEFAVEIDRLTGTDITGEGNPDAVIRTYSGGAHCCFSTLVYDLGSVMTEVLHTPESNCDGYFADLDRDGVMEFVTCDDNFAYEFCPFAGSPLVPVVLRYDEATGVYLPANTEYTGVYSDYIATDTARAAEAEPGEMGEWDDTAKCGVLPVVLEYLYSGQPIQAWNALEEYYEDPDIKLFWAEVLRIARGSSLFVDHGTAPNVDLPSYYTLQLLTVCGADRKQIGFLSSEGLDMCGEGVVYRDIYWLERELRRLGLVGEEEHIEISPEDCTKDCRLDVVNSDGERAGSIRLDTGVGFPGAVYRVNGSESEHWALRGDLAWEQR